MNLNILNIVSGFVSSLKLLRVTRLKMKYRTFHQEKCDKIFSLIETARDLENRQKYINAGCSETGGIVGESMDVAQEKMFVPRLHGKPARHWS